MLTQSDIERERYEARRKAQLDYSSGLNSSLRQGQEIGEQIGAIHFCQQVLQRPETPEEQLLAMPLDDLKRLADELKKQVLSQR